LKNETKCNSFLPIQLIFSASVAEPHHFYAAPDPALGKNFDAALALAAPAAPAPAPVPTLLYSKTKFLKQTKV
jgi:hypothetical protein